MSTMAEDVDGLEFDYARFFVNGWPVAQEVTNVLFATGRYRLDNLSLIINNVIVDVMRNENGATEADGWLGWPVTMEVWADEDAPVPAEVFVSTVREIAADLKAAGAQVRVAADFEDEL